jgi:transcriptional regulator with XRE-family HTH domain
VIRTATVTSKRPGSPRSAAVKKVKARSDQVPSALDPWGERVRRRRRRMKLTLPELARLTGLSTGWLSTIERGRQPTPQARALVQEALGMVEPVLDVRPAAPQPGSDLDAARLGACLAVVREATLADLARATDLDLDEVRQGLRNLSNGLGPWGMRVLEDGMTASLQPRQELARVPTALTAPRSKPPLTELQMAVLTMAVYWEDGLTVARIDRLRRLNQEQRVNSWSVVQALVDKGYLVQLEDSVVYRPTRLILDRTEGLETIEQLRAWLLDSISDGDKERLAAAREAETTCEEGEPPPSTPAADAGQNDQEAGSPS